MAKRLPDQAAAKLQQRLDAFNYDDSPSIMRSIIRSKNCDLGTALMGYWRGDPNYYRMFPTRYAMKGDAGADIAMFDVMVEIEERVLDGKYRKFEIAFDPFKDLTSNWAENHYELDWEYFYYDLPVEMYGRTNSRKLNEVRPKSNWICGFTQKSDGSQKMARA